MFDSAGQREINKDVYLVAIIIALLGILLFSFYNYLLLQRIIQFASAMIAVITFIIVLNNGKFIYKTPNDAFLFLGISYGIVGLFDLFYTLAYKALGGSTGYLSSEILMIVRYLESIALFLSCFLMNKQNPDSSIRMITCVYSNFKKFKKTEETLQKTISTMKYQKEYIDILYETTGKILSSATPQEDIHKLCCKVMKFLNCQAFFNYLLEGRETVMHLNACEGITAEQQSIIEFLPLGDAICGCAARDKCRIVAENIQSTQDPRTELIKTLGIRAYACHPLMANNEVIGTLAFGTKSSDQFFDEELLLMKTVAESVSVAINRKRNEDTLIRQAQELRIADQNKNEFISALSHELRNPLAAVVAGLSLTRLTDDKLIIEQAKDIIQRQIDQLCRLVDDLLDITRITNNKVILKRQMIDIISLTSTIVNDQYMLFDKKGVHLEVHLSQKPIYLDADPVRIKQIIGNLLQNSVKFTDHGGCVTIKVIEEEKDAIISIKDTGIGIKPEFLPSLFEPFKQANTSIDRSDGGLGLGLSIVKGITELHGGIVQAYSDGIGKGSEFTILLPTAKEKLEESLL